MASAGSRNDCLILPCLHRLTSLQVLALPKHFQLAELGCLSRLTQLERLVIVYGTCESQPHSSQCAMASQHNAATAYKDGKTPARASQSFPAVCYLLKRRIEGIVCKSLLHSSQRAAASQHSASSNTVRASESS